MFLFLHPVFQRKKPKMHKSCGGRASTRWVGGRSLILTRTDNEIASSDCVSTRWEKTGKELPRGGCSLPPFSKGLTHPSHLAISACGNWLWWHKNNTSKNKMRSFLLGHWVSIIKIFGITTNSFWIGPSKQRHWMKTFLFWQKQDTWEGQWVGKLHF